MSNPLVSISVITYNQEDFLPEALDSIVSQKTTFPFEIILGDDCSTDSTREICSKYKEQYPDLIKLRFPKQNMGSMPNWIENIKACTGKYIAICEGDDYWTDPYKLQKQVDFMEEHISYSMCAHAANTLMCGVLDEIKLDTSVLTISDIIKNNWGIMTASILFRKEMFVIPEWYYKIKNGDYGLQLLLSLKGDIGYLQDNMSVYRQHFGGISSTLKPLNQAAWLTYLLYEFNQYTNNKYRQQIKEKISSMYKKQIDFAFQYKLKKQAIILLFYKTISPIYPFAIKNQRR